eukprot:3347517-Karenia_brevis.AAC.1
MNIQKYVLRFDLDSLNIWRGQPLETTSWAGLDMVRLPISLNFPCAHNDAEGSFQTNASCRSWAKSIGLLPGPSSSSATSRWATTSTGQRRDDDSGGMFVDLHLRCIAYPATPPEQQTHVHHILNGIMHADDDVVTTCEDKDPAICWSMI